MPITITNQAAHLIILPLNDGESIYLAPGETSKPIEEMLVSGNEKIAKANRYNLVTTTSIAAPKKKSASDSKGKKAPKTAEAEDAESTGGEAKDETADQK